MKATTLRDSLNTVTLHLGAEFVVTNSTTLTFDLVEPRPQFAEKGAEEEFSVKLEPSLSALVSQKEVRVMYKHTCLSITTC